MSHLKESDFRDRSKVLKAQSDQIQKGLYGDIEKGGEGSKGGKIIGRTKSGHPIYQTDLHKKAHALVKHLQGKVDGWKGTAELAEVHSQLAEMHNDVNSDSYKKHEGYSKTPEESKKRHTEGSKELIDKLPEHYLKQAIGTHVDEWSEKESANVEGSKEKWKKEWNELNQKHDSELNSHVEAHKKTDHTNEEERKKLKNNYNELITRHSNEQQEHWGKYKDEWDKEEKK